MSTTLGEVFDQVVYVVNFNRTRPIKYQLFKQICTNMDSQHRRLLSHIDVRWLSRGKAQTGVHELQELFAYCI